MERISTNTEDYLENDQAIPGQSFCCISFISPDDLLKQKELYMFHKYMTQRCGEFELNIDEILKKSDDDLKNKVCSELREKVRWALKFNYDQFKEQFDNFKYKFQTELDEQFNKVSNYKTNIRGVKVRGVYSTYDEAQHRAKKLQSSDRSFHVFVGQVGYWLPWDPCADKIQDEEYMETELNTLMKEYRANEVRKDMFYDERKREKQEDAIKERLESEKEIASSLQEEDPWMASKLKREDANGDGDGDGDANGDGNSSDSASSIGQANSSEIKSI